MDEYDFIMVRGKPRYRKNKKLVNKNTLPRDVMERFGLIGEEPKEKTKTDKNCVFCGVPSKLTRFINGQTIYICNDDYYSQSTGRIVQKLRELEGASNG